mmetsp:Transcript_5811/g.8685  ORF Transcript_5811/g.8685 Transcript_5811/m.8685 type:complete len:208 (+) Transcript_5811:906-1529(+)
MNAHPHLARLLLLMHSQQVSVAVSPGLLLHLMCFEYNSINSLQRRHVRGHGVPELVHAHLLDQPHQASFLAIATTTHVAEDAQNGSAKIESVFFGYPSIHRNGSCRSLDTEIAAQHDIEAHFARYAVLHRHQPDVVDVRVRKVISGAGDSDIKLAWQIGPLRIAQSVATVPRIDLLRQGSGVVKLQRIQPCYGRSHHIAQIVQPTHE